MNIKSNLKSATKPFNVLPSVYTSSHQNWGTGSRFTLGVTGTGKRHQSQALQLTVDSFQK